MAGFRGQGRGASTPPHSATVAAPAPLPKPPVVPAKPPPPPPDPVAEVRELCARYYGGGGGTRRPDLGDVVAAVRALPAAGRGSILASLPLVAHGDTGLRISALRSSLAEEF